MLDKTQLASAQKLYVNGDYAAAIEAYEALDDATNPYLMINMANAYYKAGDYGKAAAKYYQAKRHIPRDADLNNNLGMLLDELKLNQPAMLGFGYMTVFEAFVFLLIANLLFVFRRKIVSKTALRYLLIVLFVFSLVNFIFIANNQVMKEHAVVVAASQARSGNGEEFPELFELMPGQIVDLVGHDSHWSELMVNGKRGWLADSRLEKI